MEPIVGKVQVKADYNKTYNSQGLLVDGFWYNIKGTEKECAEALSGVNKGDKVRIWSDDRREITNVETVAFEEKPEKQTDLKEISNEMRSCLEEAKEIAKDYYKDFTNPDKVIDLGIALFKAKHWGKKFD